jgi:hypothetical protein
MTEESTLVITRTVPDLDDDEPTPVADATEIKLFYFEYYDNDNGNKCTAWFATRREAKEERQRMIDADDYDPNLDEGDEYYIDSVDVYAVTPTKAGILTFAQCCASGG